MLHRRLELTNADSIQQKEIWHELFNMEVKQKVKLAQVAALHHLGPMTERRHNQRHSSGLVFLQHPSLDQMRGTRRQR